MSPILIGLVYFILSFFVGIIGSSNRFGFWGYFISSLLFTPIGGLLLLVPSDKAMKPEDKESDE